MNKLILNFFGEEVTIETPKTLQNLKKEISNKFCFSFSDASEILISYVKDLKKTFIETEKDFMNFIKKNIYKVDLDISQESQLFKKSIINLKEEIDKDKKELEILIQKEEELKKKKEEINKKNLQKIKEMREMIREINRKKNKLIKENRNEKDKISGEINKTHMKIEELQVKLKLPVNVEEKKEWNKPKKIIKKYKKKKIGKKQNGEKDMFVKFNEDIKNYIENIKKFILCKLSKKTKEMEMKKKNIEDSGVELQEEKEIKGFMDFSSISKNVSEEIKRWTNFVVQHTNELTKDLSKKYKNCLDTIASIKEEKSEKLKNKPPKKCDEIVHEGIKCKGCGMFPISGNRFKCAICQDFDYCENCEEKNKDLHKHPFIKIYSPKICPIEIQCQLK